MSKEFKILGTLNCDSINSRCRTVDWQDAMGGDFEGFTVYESAYCNDCGAEHVLNGRGEERCKDVLEFRENGDGEEVRSECEGYLLSEGPMMNYFYPLDIEDCEAAAVTLEGLPLCVVEFKDGETGLALTGGGMDLRWSICAAFIDLGYMPPLEFCNLPNMAGQWRSKRWEHVLQACQESARVAAGWAERTVKQLDELRVSIEREKAQAA